MKIISILTFIACSVRSRLKGEVASAPCVFQSPDCRIRTLSAALILSELTAEIALFAAVGGLLFALDDLFVDLIYFARAGWRSLTIYTRYPRAFADALGPPDRPGRIAVFARLG